MPAQVPGGKYRNVLIGFTPEVREELRALAAASDLSVNQLVRRAVDEYLGRLADARAARPISG